MGEKKRRFFILNWSFKTRHGAHVAPGAGRIYWTDDPVVAEDVSAAIGVREISKEKAESMLAHLNRGKRPLGAVEPVYVKPTACVGCGTEGVTLDDGVCYSCAPKDDEPGEEVSEEDVDEEEAWDEEGESQPIGEEVSEDDIKAMTKAELVDLLEGWGVEAPSRTTKANLVCLALDAVNGELVEENEETDDEAEPVEVEPARPAEATDEVPHDQLKETDAAE